jgi:hypothetical protein
MFEAKANTLHEVYNRLYYREIRTVYLVKGRLNTTNLSIFEPYATLS